jgi:hypothetical protein
VWGASAHKGREKKRPQREVQEGRPSCGGVWGASAHKGREKKRPRREVQEGGPSCGGVWGASAHNSLLEQSTPTPLTFNLK